MHALDDTAPPRNRLWGVLTVLAALLAAAGLAYWVKGLVGQADTPRKAPKIALITPSAPPPPPPPPKFEKKPDPPKEQKEMKVEQPQPKPETPQQASPELKMEGAAGNGPSAFAAGRVTSEDLAKVGAGKASGGGPVEAATGLFSPFNNYANLAKGELQRHLNRREALRKRRYSLDLHLWLAPTGAISRFELIGGTGDTDTDTAIQQALAALPTFSQPQPPNMPQPLRLRVTAGS